MTDVVKPWKVISTKQEHGGNIGVTFSAPKVTFLTSTKTRTVVVTTYISIPQDQDVDAAIFAELQRMEWL